MTELHHEIYAVDGEDIGELFDLLAPEGVLHVYNVSVFALRTLRIENTTRSLDMVNSRLTFWGDTLPAIAITRAHASHRIVNCSFVFMHTSPAHFWKRSNPIPAFIRRGQRRGPRRLRREAEI